MSSDISSTSAAAASHSKQQSEAKLVPAIYSDSPVLAIAVPIHSTLAATHLQQSIQQLVSSLQSLGCELLRIDSSNSSDVTHARVSTHRIAYIIYNKSYDASELSTALGEAGAEYASQFQGGFDLNQLLSLGEEAVWSHMDHQVCLDAKLHPNMAFFVDIAQLDASVLERYEEYVKTLSKANQSQTAPSVTISTSSSKQPPPPPNVPPSIPAPPLLEGELSFTFTSWNILSQDYAHPSSFFYIEPCYLNFQHRGPLIRATLDKHAADVECLQEVDYDAVDQGLFDSSDNSSSSSSKGSVFLRRPASKRDGCLIRWDDTKFQLQEMPHLQILDATFAKHSTERKKDTVASRIQCKEIQASNLHPRTKKEKEKKASSVANEAPAAPLTAAQRSGHHPEKTLFKRQMHVMHSISQLEERLEKISLQLNAKRGLVETAAAAVVEPAPSTSHAHVVSPSQEATYFHAVHLNDLSLLTRSKKNCTSSLFARFKRENIGLIVLLKLRQTSQQQSRQEHLFLVSNVHLFWNPEFEDVKLSQCVFLMQQLSQLRALVQQQNPHAKIHTVLGGDYNSTPNSAVYNFITQGCAEIPQITYSNAVSMAHSASSSSSSSEPIVSSNLHEIVFAQSPDTTAETQSKENGNDETQSGETVSPSTTPDPSSSTSSSSCSCSAAPSEIMERFAAHPNVHTKLLLDSTLLKVTKWLRAIGVDTICQSSTHSTSDPEAVTAAVEKFFHTARKEKRVIVTQNKALLLRRGIPTYYNLPSALKEPIDIFLDICAHFHFEWQDELFYHRCTTCNHIVLPLRHAEFKLLPFLPHEYTSGLNDDGDPLEITRCQGRSCSRVRWWSSKRQKVTRSKLFKVRMDIDVEMEEIFSQEQEKEYLEQLDKAEVEAEEKKQKAVAAAVAETSSYSSSSSSAVSTPNSGPPSVPLSREEVAAQRAARKAMKSASKARSQDADRLARKAAHISRIDFEKTALLNSLHGADGEYLFDVRVLSKELSPIQQEMKLHSQQVMRIMETANAATAAGEQLEDALLQASQNLASSPTVALWWTNEKKAKMIEVEMRIIEETRKTMLQRRRRKAKEAREAASRGAAANAGSNKNEEQDDEDIADIDVHSPIISSLQPSVPTFAQQLHRYWQDAVDKRTVPHLLKQGFDETMAIDTHQHHLKLSSAYARHDGRSLAASDGEEIDGASLGEPEFTNKTANFTDTIDYLFYSTDSLRVQRIRTLASKAELDAQDVIGYPTQEWPSDHELIQVSLCIKC